MENLIKHAKKAVELFYINRSEAIKHLAETAKRMMKLFRDFTEELSSLTLIAILFGQRSNLVWSTKHI